MSSFWSRARPTLALAFPIIAGQVSQMLMGIVDSAMVGQIGVIPLAAAAFANNLLSIPFVFGLGFLFCVSVFVAQSHGANDQREVADYFRHGVALSVLGSVLLMALVVVLSTQLHRFGQPPEVASQSRVFLLLVGASMVPTLPAFAFKNFCEALDRPWLPTIILTAAVPLNVLLNWVFIYGNLGAPELGLDGAGWATLGARLATFIVLAWVVLRSPAFRSQLPTRWLARLDGARLIEMLRLGVPSALGVFLEVGAFATGAILIGRLGADSLAAHQIALSVAATTFMIPLGLATATTIRIGQVLGAGDTAELRRVGLNSFVMTLGVACLSGVFYFVLGEAIAGRFVDDARVATIATQIFVVVAIFQIVDGLQVVASGALRGLGDATVPMLLVFFAFWIVGLPLGYALAFNGERGAVGVWMGLAVGLACSALFLTWRFWQRSDARRVAKLAEAV